MFAWSYVRQSERLAWAFETNVKQSGGFASLSTSQNRLISQKLHKSSNTLLFPLAQRAPCALPCASDTAGKPPASPRTITACTPDTLLPSTTFCCWPASDRRVTCSEGPPAATAAASAAVAGRLAGAAAGRCMEQSAERRPAPDSMAATWGGTLDRRLHAIAVAGLAGNLFVAGLLMAVWLVGGTTTHCNGCAHATRRAGGLPRGAVKEAPHGEVVAAALLPPAALTHAADGSCSGCAAPKAQLAAGLAEPGSVMGMAAPGHPAVCISIGASCGWWCRPCWSCCCRKSRLLSPDDCPRLASGSAAAGAEPIPASAASFPGTPSGAPCFISAIACTTEPIPAHLRSCRRVSHSSNRST